MFFTWKWKHAIRAVAKAEEPVNTLEQWTGDWKQWCGAQPMPLTCGRTEMLRLPSLGQENGAVFFVSAFPVILPAPTEKAVLAEHLAGNSPGRSPAMIDSSSETNSITTFTFIRYTSPPPAFWGKASLVSLASCRASMWIISSAGHTINKCLSGNSCSTPWKAPQLSQILKA